jgi:hypothetical protein
MDGMWHPALRQLDRPGMTRMILCLAALLFVLDPQRAMSSGVTDMQELCQLTLDMNALDAYFHIDERPERKPLIILRNKHVETEPALVKFGEKVRYASRDELESQGKPYFEFTDIRFEADAADIAFVYPPEGIAGDVHLVRDGAGWRIESHRIVER